MANPTVSRIELWHFAAPLPEPFLPAWIPGYPQTEPYQWWKRHDEHQSSIEPSNGGLGDNDPATESQHLGRRPLPAHGRP